VLIRNLNDAWAEVLLFGTDEAQWLAGQTLTACITQLEARTTGGDYAGAQSDARKWTSVLVSHLRTELQPGSRWPWLHKNDVGKTPLDSPRPSS